MQCLLPGMCSETFSTARAKNRAPTEADAAEILARGLEPRPQEWFSRMRLRTPRQSSAHEPFG